MNEQPKNDTITTLDRWYASEIGDLYAHMPAYGEGIVMGFPLWGPKYIDRFSRFCLPTIASPRNLSALKDKCRLVIFADDFGLNTIWRAVQPLEQWGIIPIIRKIPPEVMAFADKRKYWILGVTHNILIQMARRWRMGFSMAQPDHVHSEGFFENMGRLAGTADAIVQIGISANVETAARDLEAYRQPDGELTIPDCDLGDIGWRHLHKQMQMYCMNEAVFPIRLPNSHYVFWQGRDKLAIYCCHMNPAYISPTLCAVAEPPRNPIELVQTIDTKLPSLLKTGAVHVVGRDDGMTFIEVSGPDKAAAPKFVSAREFAATAWRQVNYSERYMPYFQQVCEIPIHEQPTGVTDDEIRAQHGQLLDLLAQEKGHSAISTLQAMAGVHEDDPIKELETGT